MISDILKIIPKLEAGDLDRMEKSLSSRFTKVAKGFGKGLSNVLKGGAILGFAGAMIQKMLSPLKEVQESIEKSLAASDDIVTNAKQFGTTPANLARLQAYGSASGLTPENLNMLLTKYQTAVAEAAADPTKQTSVRAFAGDKDMAASFFEFIQTLKKQDSGKQVLVQKEIFGEKQILKMSDFLNNDFTNFGKKISNISDKELNKSLNKQSNLNDYIDEGNSARNLGDIITKGRGINKVTADEILKAKASDLALENERIKNFASINEMNEQMKKLTQMMEEVTRKVFEELPIIMDAAKGMINLVAKSIEGWGMLIKLIKESRVFKNFFGNKGE